MMHRAKASGMDERGAVRFDEVEVRLGETDVLRSVSLELQRGETVVLLGRSGSGKSTLLRLVNALLLPDRGTVRVEGAPTVEWDRIRLRRRIGYVMQEVGLFPHYTVAESVEIVPRLLGWAEPLRRDRTEEMLDLVGLPSEYGTRYPHELSGGERQRVGVARALAADPGILLCDEPFGALDPITRYELQRQFRALSRGLDKTLLFVTHDVGEALYLGDRIALLESGEVRFVGTPEAFREAEDPVARAFLEAGAGPSTRPGRAT